MPLVAQESGFVENPSKQLTFAKWQRSICNGWFSTQTFFLAYVANAPIIFPDPFKDIQFTRALGVFAHFVLVEFVSKCDINRCKSDAKLTSATRSDNGKLRYQWICSTSGGKHTCKSVVGLALLANKKNLNLDAFAEFDRVFATE